MPTPNGRSRIRRQRSDRLRNSSPRCSSCSCASAGESSSKTSCAFTWRHAQTRGRRCLVKQLLALEPDAILFGMDHCGRKGLFAEGCPPPRLCRCIQGLPSRSSRRRRELKAGGGRGIRTPGTLPGTAVFKTATIDHSVIPPILRGAPPHTPARALAGTPSPRSAPSRPRRARSVSQRPIRRQLLIIARARSLPAHACTSAAPPAP